MNDTPADAPLQYADMGYPVFPCRFNKKPATAHGYLDAVTDPEQIRKWWNENPAYNVGLSAAGALVIDFDTPEHPWLVFPWPAGMPVSRTPRGGWHHWMRRPLGKNWPISSGDLAPDLDVRTDGGYAVEFPSVTEHGSYTWVEPLRPHELLPAPPRWLVGVLDHHYPPDPPAEAPPGYPPRLSRDPMAPSRVTTSTPGAPGKRRGSSRQDGRGINRPGIKRASSPGRARTAIRRRRSGSALPRKMVGRCSTTSPATPRRFRRTNHSAALRSTRS